MSDQQPGQISIWHILGLILRHGQKLLVYPAAFNSFLRGEPQRIATPAMLGIPYMAPLLRTSDGVDLSCYFLPQTEQSLAKQHHVRLSGDIRVDLTPAASDARATVIVFHGNAAHHWEDMGAATHLFEMKCNVFLLSYRGYSLSSGTPNEKGIQIDAQTALDYILNQPYLRQTPIILYGHSLGGAVAIDLASRNPSKVSGVIVSNTFTSIPDIVRRWPYIGIFSFICHQKWRSVDKMRSIPATTPILMLSGSDDEVIPCDLMVKLWEAAQKRGVRQKPTLGSCVSAADDVAEVSPANDTFVKIEGGMHNNTTYFADYWPAIRKYIRNTTHSAKDRPPLMETDPAPSPAAAQGQVDRRWRYIDRKLVVIVDKN